MLLYKHVYVYYIREREREREIVGEREREREYKTMYNNLFYFEAFRTTVHHHQGKAGDVLLYEKLRNKVNYYTLSYILSTHVW